MAKDHWQIYNWGSRKKNDVSAEQVTTLRYQLYHGTLSQRILSQLKADFRRPALHEAYRPLGDCLQSNTLLQWPAGDTLSPGSMAATTFRPPNSRSFNRQRRT